MLVEPDGSARMLEQPAGALLGLGLRGSHALDAQALCDRLLAELDDTVEDDVALLLRVGAA